MFQAQIRDLKSISAFPEKSTRQSSLKDIGKVNTDHFIDVV